MQQFQTLEFSIEDNVAIIKLNRPDAANGLTPEMAEELMQAALIADTDASIRAVLLTANGKMFCAGGDLKTFASFGDELTLHMKKLIVHMHSAITKFAQMRAPVVVAVNGMAAGAGFSIAVSGDLVFAAESAQFTMAYTAAGLSPDGSASYYLPRLIGLRKTQELMLNNNRISAEEALELSAITQVVSDDALYETALTTAKKLAKGPTNAYGSVKTLLAHSFDNSLEAQLELEGKLMANMSQTEDGKEGINAFVNKRKPEYKGC
jgi:2-(1,2-epoxy-1,2-dihydrophenyl)acetyl-CoA isomerase